MIHGDVKVYKPKKDGSLKHTRTVKKKALFVRKDPGIESWSMAPIIPENQRKFYVPVRDGTQ